MTKRGHHLLDELDFQRPFGRRFGKEQMLRFEELLGILSQDQELSCEGASASTHFFWNYLCLILLTDRR